MVGENAAIERLWPQVMPRVMILPDDHGFASFQDQYDMWNGFARSVDRVIVTLPAGQGFSCADASGPKGPEGAGAKRVT